MTAAKPFRYLILAALIILSPERSRAEETKLVGTWIGFDFPLYTKLVLSDDGWLTYCAVSSCRNVQCFDMAYAGSLDSTFTYSDELRSWRFQRLSPQKVKGYVTTISGTAAEVVYEIETPPASSLPPESGS